MDAMGQRDPNARCALRIGRAGAEERLALVQAKLGGGLARNQAVDLKLRALGRLVIRPGRASIGGMSDQVEAPASVCRPPSA